MTNKTLVTKTMEHCQHWDIGQFILIGIAYGGALGMIFGALIGLVLGNVDAAVAISLAIGTVVGLGASITLAVLVARYRKEIAEPRSERSNAA